MNPIRRLRKTKGWTQKEVAAKIGVRYQQYGYWERKPDIKFITDENKMRIAKAFGTNLIGLWMERRKMRVEAAMGKEAGQ